MGRSPSARWRRIKRTSPIRPGCGGSDLEAVCAVGVPRPARLKATRFHRSAVAAPICDPDCRPGAVMDWRTEAGLRGMLLWKRQGLESAGRFQHRDRLIILVLRRRPHLIARPFERDPLDLVLVATGPETQGTPRNRNFA